MKSLLAGALLFSICCVHQSAGEPKVLPLWPSTAPGEKGEIGPEADTTKETDNKIAGRRLIRLGNVSKPTLSVYPPAVRKTDAAVVIFPGGGYHILAWDLEGTEVCEWLNAQGMTAILVKYRVPKRPNVERYVPPLQDAQRAMGLIRQHAVEWNIDPGKIGVLGFSAGGHLAATVSNTEDERTYPAIDEADKLPSRPNFTVLIYTAGLSNKDQNDKISPELHISTNTPPAFLAMTMDDGVRVENNFAYAIALKNAKVPCELHIYPKGGHGYGLRRTADLVTTWPDRLADWLKNRNLLPK